MSGFNVPLNPERPTHTRRQHRSVPDRVLDLLEPTTLRHIPVLPASRTWMDACGLMARLVTNDGKETFDTPATQQRAVTTLLTLFGSMATQVVAPASATPQGTMRIDTVITRIRGMARRLHSAEQAAKMHLIALTGCEPPPDWASRPGYHPGRLYEVLLTLVFMGSELAFITVLTPDSMCVNYRVPHELGLQKHPESE